MGVRRRRLLDKPADIIEAIRRFRSDIILSRISAKVPPTSEQYRKASEANKALCELADELNDEAGTLQSGPHSNPRSN